MIALVTFLHVVLCLFLILVVLLQPGKGGDMGSVFGGGSSGSVLGARGAATILTTITRWAAALFMVTSVGLVYLNAHSSRQSVVDQSATSVTPPVATPPAAAPDKK